MPKPPVKKPCDVMIDLETRGKRPGCAIVSIGAVLFDVENLELLDELYVVVSLSSCEKLGLHVDPDTTAWWSQQSPEARMALTLSESKSPSKNKGIGRALDMLTEFVKPIGKRRVRVWANGPEFDVSILDAAYAAAKRELPWEFWNSHSLRTIRLLNPSVPKPPFEGAAHNALADAKHQAQHVVDILRASRS